LTETNYTASTTRFDQIDVSMGGLKEQIKVHTQTMASEFGGLDTVIRTETGLIQTQVEKHNGEVNGKFQGFNDDLAKIQTSMSRFESSVTGVKETVQKHGESSAAGLNGIQGSLGGFSKKIDNLQAGNALPNNVRKDLATEREASAQDRRLHAPQITASSSAFQRLENRVRANTERTKTSTDGINKKLEGLQADIITSISEQTNASIDTVCEQLGDRKDEIVNLIVNRLMASEMAIEHVLSSQKDEIKAHISAQVRTATEATGNLQAELKNHATIHY
jgi:DNA anti-recombination protein RmuC